MVGRRLLRWLRSPPTSPVLRMQPRVIHIPLPQTGSRRCWLKSQLLKKLHVQVCYDRRDRRAHGGALSLFIKLTTITEACRFQAQAQYFSYPIWWEWCSLNQIKEHKNACAKSLTNKSAIAEHAWTKDHPIKWAETKILQTSEQGHGAGPWRCSETEVELLPYFFEFLTGFQSTNLIGQSNVIANARPNYYYHAIGSRSYSHK